MVKGGNEMAESKRLQITVSWATFERLVAMCNEKGLGRSGIVSLAINELWKEEHADEK